MAGNNYTRFNLVIQKLASSKLTGWFLSRTLHHIDRIFLRLSGNRKTLTSLLTGVPVGLVTTTGARSGLPRTQPLLCLADESNPNRLAVIASNFGNKRHPAWYYNLKANPTATCSIGGTEKEYAAHEAEGEEYERLWQLAEQVYLGFPQYKKLAGSRRIPIIVLTPLT